MGLCIDDMLKTQTYTQAISSSSLFIAHIEVNDQHSLAYILAHKNVIDNVPLIMIFKVPSLYLDYNW